MTYAKIIILIYINNILNNKLYICNEMFVDALLSLLKMGSWQNFKKLHSIHF
jgi:hypothetical protein